MIKINTFALATLLLMQSCVSKKEILYLQDIDSNPAMEVAINTTTLQPNDILKIDIGALMPEAALPYNKTSPVGIQAANNLEVMKLEGYLVSATKTIQFPVLGELSVAGKSIADLEIDIKNRLEIGGYLLNPSVTVRLLNAKVTILGEVKQPGTFTFTENNISLLQALGLAGDLTINGDREDVILIREADGQRSTTHLNLTESTWLNGPYQNIQPNDVLVVNPNNAKVKTAGYIGNVSVVLAMASLILTSIVLLTNN
ncbi:MAG: polysaccharide biosynthesis/export family protein [Flavobacteriaceae bacterium]|nr:polysaccharide biosynthesis/export family protein [Flavobacteriaceae bacterium]